MRIYLPAVSFCLALAAFYFVPTNIEASRRNQERLIDRLPIERNEPIAIRSVRVGGKKVRRNSRFVADDDWLGGLVIDIKNRSEKVILLATVQLQFPRPAGSDLPVAVDEVFFGNYQSCSGLPNMPANAPRLMPGESAEISLSVGEFEGIQTLLAANGYSTSPESVLLRVGKVVFEDNTMWLRGSTLQRDKKSPHVWTQIDSRGLTKNTSFKPTVSTISRETNYPRFRSSPWLEPTFLNASFYRTATVAQSGCHRWLNTVNLDCGVAGWACQYEKDVLSEDYGCYYLAAASFRCKTSSGENCGVNYHNTQIANACSGCNGGGGGGDGGGGNEGGDCWSDWDCSAGEECCGGTCQQYSPFGCLQS